MQIINIEAAYEYWEKRGIEADKAVEVVEKRLGELSLHGQMEIDLYPEAEVIELRPNHEPIVA